MGHFIRNNRIFNAFINRLTYQDYNEITELEIGEDLDKSLRSTHHSLNQIKSDQSNERTN